MKHSCLAILKIVNLIGFKANINDDIFISVQNNEISERVPQASF